MFQLLEMLIPGFSTVPPVVWIIFAVLVVAFYVLYVVGLWRVFTKAGLPGWKSLIPLYNIYCLFTMCWSAKAFANVVIYIAIGVIAEYQLSLEPTGVLFWMLAASAIGCTIYSIFVEVTLYQKLSTAFGHGALFGVGLYLFQAIFMMILGLGKSQYEKPLVQEPIVPVDTDR